ncbi:hypothetical protein JB92DRAFT_3130157 [Gautieria morchelliformis]|nr:hypothetical protein JB92DRAFT_3130157 [Gautieria morchelliformis]
MSYAPALPPPPNVFPRSTKRLSAQHHTAIAPLEPTCPATPANFRPEDNRALDLVASIPERTMCTGGYMASRTAELDGELDRLKRDLEVANERYDEVNVALSKERTAKMPQEDRAATSTADDLTASSSSFGHLDRFKDTLQENEQLKLAKAQLESDVDMLRNLYTQASDAHQARLVEIGALKRDNDSFREQATTGIKQAQMFWTTQIHKLEKELTRSTGTIEVLTGQARRADDVRRQAALLPMAQKEVEAAKQEAEDWRSRFMDMGVENTKLRLEVKEWEDEAMARQKNEQDVKEQESTLEEDELVWICPWMNTKRETRCGALLKSREKLREHVHEHI